MDSPKPTIRFCVNNPRTLTERNALIAAGYPCLGCLGNCELCFETRYLEVESENIVGESYEQILEIANAKKTPRDERGMEQKSDG